jgi:hypothetical protein
MPGPWKAWKSKSSFPTLSTAPWKSRKEHEIPTFPQPLATIILVLSLKTKNQRKEVGRHAASSFSYPALPPVDANRFHAHRSIRKCCPTVRA